MRTKDTKERILLTSLRLFAQNGYAAVSVRDIAQSLGMTKGALYKHYANKRDIFDSIVARMEQGDAENAAACGVPEGTKEEMPQAYEAATVLKTVQFAKTMFRYWVTDDFAAPFRRMLTLEQYNSEEMGRLYQQYLAAGPLGYTADIFASLGVPEPAAEAAAFYGPMFLYYSVYDGAGNKTAALAAAEALLDKAGEHILQLIRKEAKK